MLNFKKKAVLSALTPVLQLTKTDSKKKKKSKSTSKKLKKKLRKKLLNFVSGGKNAQIWLNKILQLNANDMSDAFLTPIESEKNTLLLEGPEEELDTKSTHSQGISECPTEDLDNQIADLLHKASLLDNKNCLEEITSEQIEDEDQMDRDYAAMNFKNDVTTDDETSAHSIDISQNGNVNKDLVKNKFSEDTNKNECENIQGAYPDDKDKNDQDAYPDDEDNLSREGPPEEENTVPEKTITPGKPSLDDAEISQHFGSDPFFGDLENILALAPKKSPDAPGRGEANDANFKIPFLDFDTMVSRLFLAASKKN